jgi:serine/threonine protein kinase/tetratricopeptide (TPR) repeat protein
MIGQTISHYRILEKIGEGGMGVVYKAEDLALNRPVAIKVLPPELLTEPTRKERFIQEAQAASAINHPNIAQVHELGEHEGIHFIVMEYIEGKTLRQLARAKKLKLKKLMEIMIQVTDALTKAHKKGIVHRDLKPENIMINEDGLVKVLDFGLAKLIEKTVSEDRLSKASTRAITESGVGTVIGTPFYMAPEQAKGEAIDHRSDIFSLSVVMYEMASGIRPFQGKSNVEVLSSILKEEPKPISEINKKIPYQLQHIIHKALAKRRDDRYQTIKDMWVDLREVKRDLESGSAPVISDVRPAAKAPVSKKTLMWATAGVVSLLVILVGVYFLFQGKIPTGVSKKPSVAVLWFENISGDEEEDYFSEGITEELITELWKIGGLKVNSLDDIRLFKDKSLSARDIGKQLGFDYILTGSIQKESNRVRVTPRLIDVTSASIVWTDRFEDEFKSIFDLQDSIAFNVAQKLKVKLTPEEKQNVASVPTESQEAYDHYLKGRHYYYRTTFGDNELAVKEFQKALQLDSEYALAVAGLADAYVQRYKERYDFDEVWLDQAKQLTEKALNLDPDLAEAYESQAEVLLEESNLLGALESAEKARSLQPKLNEPYVRLGEIYLKRGERRKALEMFKKALSIRSSVEALCGLGEIYHTRGDLDKAEESYHKALELNPNHERPCISLGKLYRDRNKTEKAEEFYRQAIQARPDRKEGYEGIIGIFYYTGRMQEAEKIARGFAERYPYHWDAYQLLYDYLAWWKGDYAAAMKVIQEAADRNPDRFWPQIMLAWSYSFGMDKIPQPEKAIQALEKALSLRPRSIIVLSAAASVYVDLGDFQKALDYTQQALKICPGHGSLLHKFASIYYLKADFEDGIEHSMKAMKQAPGRWTGYYRFLENAMLQVGREEEYLQLIEKAAYAYGKDEPAFLRELCRQQRLLGHYEEAITTCKECLSVKEKGSTWFELGLAQWLAGDSSAALESFEKGQDYPSCVLWKIRVLRFEGRFKEIEEYLEEVKIPSPTRSSGMEVWFWYGTDHYASMEQWDKALTIAKEARESGEISWAIEADKWVAKIHIRKGDLDQAKSMLEDIVAKASHNYRPWPYWDLSTVEAIQGNLEEALDLATKAYTDAFDPDAEESLMHLQAIYLYALGREDEALELIKKIKGPRRSVWRVNLESLYQKAQFEVLSESPDAEYHLRRVLLRATRATRGEKWSENYNEGPMTKALVLAHLRKSDEAIKEMKRLMKMEPKRSEVAYCAAGVYSLLGDSDKALHWLQIAVERDNKWLWWARVDPDLDPLRKDPRFKKIMKDWDTRLQKLLQ